MYNIYTYYIYIYILFYIYIIPSFKTTVRLLTCTHWKWTLEVLYPLVRT